MHHISMERANLSFWIKHPSRQCSASRVLDYLLRFHSLPHKRVPVFQVPSVVKKCWECQAKVPRCYWEACVVEAARGGCGSSVARGPFGTFTPRSPGTGRLSNLPMRWCCGVPGVWRLPVWEQADDITAECFSLLGSWSLKTRIPHRTHTQLYGTMCGKLDSIHQVWAPPGQSWRCRSRRPYAMVTSSLRTIVRPTRRGAWIGKNLFLYLTSQLLQDKHTWTHRGGASRKGCLHPSAHQIYSGSSWLDTGWLPRGWRHSSCIPVSISQIQVFPGLWGSSVLQSWAFVREKGN